MNFIETGLSGVFKIEYDIFTDTRGSFGIGFSKKELNKSGINFETYQVNFVSSSYENTFRGFHFQSKPYEQAKIIICNKGRIIDYVIDVQNMMSVITEENT